MLPKRLPAAPFGRWLEAYADATGLSDPETAAYLGVTPRRTQVYRLGGSGSVAFDVVDRALSNASWVVEVDGRAVFGIDDLYPELEELAA